MRRPSLTLAVVIVALIFAAAPAISIQYVAEGRLLLSEDTGLASTVDLDGAKLTFLIDVADDVHAIFPTRTSGPSDKDVLGRFPGISARMTIRSASNGAVLFDFAELLPETSIPIGTANLSLGADYLTVGIPLSSSTTGIPGTRFTTLPSIMATLSQQFSSFTTFETANGILDNVALPPSAAELITAAVVGVGRLRIFSLSNEQEFSFYELTDASITAIPEPSAAVAIGIGLMLLGARRKVGGAGSKHFWAALLFAIPSTILFSSTATAFNPKQCWNLAACPGSTNPIQFEQTFYTYLDTDTHPSGHCANIWVIHFNPNHVEFVNKSQVSFNSDASLTNEPRSEPGYLNGFTGGMENRI